MMIPMKDPRFVQPQYYPQQYGATYSNIQLVVLILASLHTLYSLWCFFVDISSIFMLWESGQFALAILFLCVGTLKHACQLIWFLKTLEISPTKDATSTLILEIGLGVLGISLGAYIWLIFAETHSMIDVFLHPHVIEFASFVITDAVAVVMLVERKADFEMMFASYQMPMSMPVQPKVPEVEMSNFVMQKPVMAPNGYMLVPAF